MRRWVIWSSAPGCVLVMWAAVSHAGSQPASRPHAAARDELGGRRGLITATGEACAGYTFFAPLTSTTTYLVDHRGELVHTWSSKYTPGQSACLLEDGSVLRCAREPGNRHFGGGGIGGRIQRIALDGKLLWDFVLADEKRCQHHDIRPLPNGNVLLIAWDKKTRDEAIAAGRDPQELTGELWPDCVLEVQPQGESGGDIVWEWHVWDHLVQDLDKKKPNYGVVAEHPELVNMNHRLAEPPMARAELRRLRSLGYVGGAEPQEPAEKSADKEAPGPRRLGPHGPGPGGFDPQADWCHTNAIDYNAKLDQIALSVNNFNEIWIIDHSTSTKEAAGHSGGRYGKGGDLLYRWGNPAAYGAGDRKNQVFFAQHDVRWIPQGCAGAGNLMVFNNGRGRPGGHYSTVVEFAPPIDASGKYPLSRGKAFEPVKPCWEYAAANKADLFSGSISGAQRLPNGNTLICSGEQGRMLEVDAAGKIVWEYINPYVEHDGPEDKFGPPPGPPPGQAGKHPPRRPGPPDGPPGPPQEGSVFRATRLGPDHPGIQRVLEANAERAVQNQTGASAE